MFNPEMSIREFNKYADEMVHKWNNLEEIMTVIASNLDHPCHNLERRNLTDYEAADEEEPGVEGHRSGLDPALK